MFTMFWLHLLRWLLHFMNICSLWPHSTVNLWTVNSFSPCSACNKKSSTVELLLSYPPPTGWKLFGGPSLSTTQLLFEHCEYTIRELVQHFMLTRSKQACEVHDLRHSMCFQNELMWLTSLSNCRFLPNSVYFIEKSWCWAQVSNSCRTHGCESFVCLLLIYFDL